MQRLNSEPSLNPPENREHALISESVSDLTELELALEIENYGLIESCKKEILFIWIRDIEEIQKCELPKYARNLLSDLFDVTPFKELVCNVLHKSEIEECREVLIDYQINQDPPEKEYDERF